MKASAVSSYHFQLDNHRKTTETLDQNFRPLALKSKLESCCVHSDETAPFRSFSKHQTNSLVFQPTFNNTIFVEYLSLGFDAFRCY
jgi:hypothetical protein